MKYLTSKAWISNDGNYRAQSCLLPVLPFISLPALAGVIEPTGLVTNLNLIELEGLMAWVSTGSSKLQSCTNFVWFCNLGGFPTSAGAIFLSQFHYLEINKRNIFISQRYNFKFKCLELYCMKNCRKETGIGYSHFQSFFFFFQVKIKISTYKWRNMTKYWYCSLL